MLLRELSARIVFLLCITCPLDHVLKLHEEKCSHFEEENLSSRPEQANMAADF